MMDLITYEDFARHFPGTHRRTIERMSLAGRFPPMVRMTPGGPPLWNRGAVDGWLLEKLAPLHEMDE